MMRRFEDRLGKMAIILFYLFVSVVQLLGLGVLIKTRNSVDIWPIVLTQKALSLAFVGMIVLLTLKRLPAVDTASGLLPRLTAIAGTLGLMLLILIPSGHTSSKTTIVSTLLIALGTALSLYCLNALGRSFSIMASARKLVIDGPYAIMRHPLYFAEAVTCLGIVLSKWSLVAVFIGIVWWLFQYRRMINEEAVLARSFPEYGAYSENVPRIFPRWRWAS